MRPRWERHGRDDGAAERALGGVVADGDLRTTTSFGTGTYYFDPPIVPNQVTSDIVGVATLKGDAMGVAQWDGTNSRVYLRDATGALVTSLNPAWASGDTLRFTIRYRVY